MSESQGKTEFVRQMLEKDVNIPNKEIRRLWAETGNSPMSQSLTVKERRRFLDKRQQTLVHTNEAGSEYVPNTEQQRARKIAAPKKKRSAKSLSMTEIQLYLDLASNLDRAILHSTARRAHYSLVKTLRQCRDRLGLVKVTLE